MLKVDIQYNILAENYNHCNLVKRSIKVTVLIKHPLIMTAGAKSFLLLIDNLYMVLGFALECPAILVRYSST